MELQEAEIIICYVHKHFGERYCCIYLSGILVLFFDFVQGKNCLRETYAFSKFSTNSAISSSLEFTTVFETLPEPVNMHFGQLSSNGILNLTIKET